MAPPEPPKAGIIVGSTIEARKHERRSRRASRRSVFVGWRVQRLLGSPSGNLRVVQQATFTASEREGIPMAFIEPLPEDQVDDRVRELYEADRERFGFVPNFTRVFARRPQVYQAWKQLNGTIKESMGARRYELATLAAARRLRSRTECSPTAKCSPTTS